MAKGRSPIFSELRNAFKICDVRFRKNKVIEIAKYRWPRNPRTEAQQQIRTRYGQLVEEWRKLSADQKAEYERRARKLKLSGWNLYVMENFAAAPPAGIWYEVTVSEQSGNDLSDYQVLLIIDGDSEFFQDAENKKEAIRVYDEDKSTMLSYYIEEWDPANLKAKIWIKVPSIPANGTKKVYIKIDPSLTEDLSNPEAVFDFYDNFEDLTKWSEVKDGNSYIAVANGLLEIHSDGSNRAYARSNEVFHAPFILEVMAKRVEDVEIAIHWDGEISGQYDTVYNGYLALGYASWRTPPYFYLKKYENGSGNELDTYNYELDDQFHIYKIEARTNGITVYMDDNEILSTSDTTFKDGYIGLSGREKPEGIVAYYDWIRIRKYAKPEPSVSYTKVSS